MSSEVAFSQPELWLYDQEYFSQEERPIFQDIYRLCQQADARCAERMMLLCQILKELNMNAELIAAGLCVYPYDAGLLNDECIVELSERHNMRIDNIIKGLQQISLIDHLHEQEQSNIEGLRRMLLAMANDIRIVILKLALKLVEMRYIHERSPQEQQLLALQTRDIFAPLANRLGIARLKWELEDLSLRSLEPDIYNEINDELEGNRVDRERYIQNVIHILEKNCAREGITVLRIYGRIKHINSIYMKMKRKHLKFSQLNDVRAVRIEVQSEEECYAALGVVHGLWTYIPAEFDDYIANKKSNGYQSLHTSVVGPEGHTLEVQIRTHDMHEKAELGVAAHWRYKEKNAKLSHKFEEQINWLRQILEGGDANRGDVMLDRFKTEAFRDRVYAVTPQGRVVDLPEGSTPLDFAYYIHTDLGHRCRGAQVNGQLVPLTTPLNNGDQVSILTSKKPAPSLDWLNEHLGYLQSPRAKAKVRNYFKRQQRETSIEEGRELLEKELRRMDIKDPPWEVVCRALNVQNAEDLYAEIGFGEITVLSVIHEIEQHEKEQNQDEPSLHERLAQLPLKPPRKKQNDIVIEGLEDLVINYASCCQPVPVCDIEGFITKGCGVNIHRSECPNLQHLKRQHPERILHVRWSDEAFSELFAVKIYLFARDRNGILRDITQILNNEHVAVSAVNVHKEQSSGVLEGTLDIDVHDMEQLSRLIDRLAQVRGVQNVRRVQQ